MIFHVHALTTFSAVATLLKSDSELKKMQNADGQYWCPGPSLLSILQTVEVPGPAYPYLNYNTNNTALTHNTLIN